MPNNLFGITVKNVKRFKDHDGLEIKSGDVYRGKEYLGHWEEDYYGGDNRLDFPQRMLEKEVEAFKKSKYIDDAAKRSGINRDSIIEIADASLLIYEYVTRKWYEKLYRQATRGKDTSLCVMNITSSSVCTHTLPMEYASYSDEEILSHPDLRPEGAWNIVVRKPSDLF